MLPEFMNGALTHYTLHEHRLDSDISHRYIDIDEVYLSCDIRNASDITYISLTAENENGSSPSNIILNNTESLELDTEVFVKSK